MFNGVSKMLEVLKNKTFLLCIYISLFLVNPCHSEPCLNGATCVSDSNNNSENFTCICAPGFQGPLCEGLHLKSFCFLYFCVSFA